MSRRVGALKAAACRHARGRRDLSLLARLVLEELVDFHNAGRGCAWPSRATLADRLGRGQTQIGEALNELVGAGLVEIRKSAAPVAAGHLRNAYRLDLEGLAGGGDPRRLPGPVPAAADATTEGTKSLSRRDLTLPRPTAAWSRSPPEGRTVRNARPRRGATISPLMLSVV